MKKRVIGYIAVTITGIGVTAATINQSLTQKLTSTPASYFVCEPSAGVSVQSIYDCLMRNYAEYQGITFNPPSTNLLSTTAPTWNADNWFFQTPNIWGSTIAQYVQMFQNNVNNLDPCFNLPVCTVDANCTIGGTPQYPGKCMTPNFLSTGPVTSCPNSSYTAQGTKLCLTGAHAVMQSIYSDIINAQTSIDISSLNPSGKMLNDEVVYDYFDTLYPQTPPGAFFYLIKKSLEDLAATQRQVTVRILGGSPVEFDAAKNFLSLLTKDMLPNNLTIYVSPEVSCAGTDCPNPYVSSYLGSEAFEAAWNHGKIIRVDQTALYYGGENLWGADYLSTGNSGTSLTGPVTDAIVRIQGPIVHDAYMYNNYMWQYIDNNPSGLPRELATSNYCYQYRGNTINYQDTCQAPYANSESAQAATGTGLPVKSLYVAKLNGLEGRAPAGMSQAQDTQADQSEPARVYAMQLATSSIKIAQQSLFLDAAVEGIGYVWPADPGFSYPNPIDTLQAIAYALSKTGGPDVYILTTAPGSGGYASMENATYTYKFMCKLLIRTFGFNATDATARLNAKLNLGYISYNNGTDQASGFQGLPAHHNKFWMIDDKLFYYGSHNIYPSALQQFGVILEDASGSTAADQIKNAFWVKAWANANTGEQVLPAAAKNCSNL